MPDPVATPSWKDMGLPPYGHLCSDWVVARGKPAVPDDFTINAKVPTVAEWTAWLESLADELAEFLWPRFDPTTSTWIGSATSTAVDLTRADFRLMKSLKSLLWQPIAARIPNGTLHRVFFDAEDRKPPGHDYALYDPAMPAKFTADLPEVMLEGVTNVRPLMLMLKQRLQRPRPFQASMLLGEPDFFHASAKSADTPSLVSGHCLQGAIGGCTAFFKLEPYLNAVDRSKEFLQQLTVDPGDRRVFAGVHYPSDNIASWFCALRLCSNFFGDEGKNVKGFLWGAIQRSSVFLAIKQAVDADPKSAFATGVQRLKAEAAK